MIDFELTETQRQLVDTARDFGREVIQPAEIALDRMADPEEVFKSDLYWDVMKQAYGLGFHKMNLPEQYGGLEIDPQTSGLVREELARWGAGFASSFMSVAIVPQLIAFLAPHNQELVDKYLIPFCNDEKASMISAWCSGEAEIGSDGKNYYDPKVHHGTKAVKTDTGWSITGAKSDFTSNGGIATVYVVFACVDSSMGIPGSGTFIVDGDAPGVTRGKTVDRIGLRTLSQAPLYLDEVEIPESHLIFPHGEGYPMLHNSIITVGNIGVGYLALGLMRAAFEDALEHARDRVQWGKPIAEHQLIAEKLFKAHTAIEAARGLLWKASWHCKQGFPGDLKASLTAKIFATNEAVKHTAEMVQVLGGYGISKEYRLEKYSRDAKLLRIMDGTNETLMTKAASLL